ncbi:MAG: hypothetical protein R2822_29475 [Spirosomataceae bacterium]
MTPATMAAATWCLDLATFFSGKTHMYNATDKRVIYSELSYRWAKYFAGQRSQLPGMVIATL